MRNHLVPLLYCSDKQKIGALITHSGVKNVLIQKFQIVRARVCMLVCVVPGYSEIHTDINKGNMGRYIIICKYYAKISI